MSLPPPLERIRLRLRPAERALLGKATSFALIGVVNLGVDFTVFSTAYFYLGLSIIAANVISWCIAVTGSCTRTIRRAPR